MRFTLTWVNYVDNTRHWAYAASPASAVALFYALGRANTHINGKDSIADVEIFDNHVKFQPETF